MSDKTEEDKKREHEDTLARISSRKEAFARSPFWFTTWDVSTKILNVAFWLCFWFLVASCSCDNCFLD